MPTAAAQPPEATTFNHDNNSSKQRPQAWCEIMSAFHFFHFFHFVHFLQQFTTNLFNYKGHTLYMSFSLSVARNILEWPPTPTSWQQQYSAVCFQLFTAYFGKNYPLIFSYNVYTLYANSSLPVPRYILESPPNLPHANINSNQGFQVECESVPSLNCLEFFCKS